MNHLSIAMETELNHQCLSHPGYDTLWKTQLYMEGMRKPKMPDDLHTCDTCAKAKLTKQPRGKPVTIQPLMNNQEIHLDFGFIAMEKLAKPGQKDNREATPKVKTKRPPRAR